MNNTYDVFLSYTWSDVDEVVRISEALTSGGMSVFRDEHIPTFDGITEGLARALDSAKVLLAFYSARYTARYACQWELTRAFLAAQRLGDPRDRVLVINPEPEEGHIAPAELEDAGYFSLRGSGGARAGKANLDPLVARIRGKVAAATVPLGAARGGAVSQLPAQVVRPRRFVGRYPELWRVHSTLHARHLRAVRAPVAASVAVIKGFTGTGKTALAEQYAFLFQDAYPGGVFWLDLAAGDGPAVTAGEVVARYTPQVREVAAGRLGLNTTGVRLERLRTMVANELTARDRPTLWIVDDVPSGMDPALLDRLLVPSPQVHTVLTAREVTPAWDAVVVEPGGMTVVEGEELFGLDWKAMDRADRLAVAQLVRRCGGHPFVLAATAARLRNSQGIGTAEHLVERLERTATSVVDVLRDRIHEAPPDARLVLWLAATLATAPVDGELILPVLAPLLRENVEQRIGEALTELDRRSLVQRLDRLQPVDHRQRWRVHALVADAAALEADRRLLDDLTRRAAAVLVRLLAADRDPDLHLYQHARELARRDTVPADERLALLRAVVRFYRRQGDVVAAREVVADLLTVASTGSGGVDDLTTAAQIAITAGEYKDAVRYCQQAIRIAGEEGDVHRCYRARFRCAQAYEYQGLYEQADAVFYDDANVQAEGLPPDWMPAEERMATMVSLVAGRRMRGAFTEALDMVGALLPELPQDSHQSAVGGVWPAAMVELARLQLLTSAVRKARQTSARVMEAYEALGMREHPLYLEAVGVHAEAEQGIALTEFTARDAEWAMSTKKLEALHADYEHRLGADNPVTLSFALLWGRTLLGIGQPRRAMEVLTAAEEAIVRVLGEEHPMRYRARHGVAQAHGQLRDFERSAAILTELLDQQVATQGRHHPDSLTAKLDLGTALLMCQRHDEGRRLIEEAERELHRQFGWSTELSFRSKVTKVLSVLPRQTFELYKLYERTFGRWRPG